MEHARSSDSCFQACRPDASLRSPGPGESGGSPLPGGSYCTSGLYIPGLFLAGRCPRDHLGPADRIPAPSTGGPDRDLLEGCLRQGLLADVFLCRPAASIFLGPVLGKMLAKFLVAGFRAVTVGELRL